MSELPNKNRNDEVSSKISSLKELGIGAQTDKHTGEAQSLALLDVAESLQLMQLQLTETSKEVRQTMSASAELLNGVIKTAASSATDQAKGAAWLSVALIFVTVVLALFTGFQGWEVLGQRDDAQKVNSANLALGFADKLDQGIYKQITDAVETPGLIILKPKGKFSGDQLEQLLGQYDTVGEMYSEGLINARISYDLFSYDITAVYGNAEVTTYLKSLRDEKHDSTLYDKFDYLAQTFTGQEKTGISKGLDQP